MKKNIIKSVIALSFIVGAIVSFNVDAKARVDTTKVPCNFKQYRTCHFYVGNVHCTLTNHYTKVDEGNK